MSGALGQLLGGLFRRQPTEPGQASPIAGIFEQILAPKQGEQTGLAALVSRFQEAGLGQAVASWIGTGENAPISADHVAQVFTPEEIEAWAKQAGTTPEALQGVLAQSLPQLVDRLTPAGQLPRQLPDLGGLLRRLLGDAASSAER